MQIPLTKLKKGSKARIIEFSGGKTMAQRLSSLGLHPGRSIIKLSSFAMRGPVTVRAGQTVLAIGHSMAEKVIVEVQGEVL